MYQTCLGFFKKKAVSLALLEKRSRKRGVLMMLSGEFGEMEVRR